MRLFKFFIAALAFLTLSCQKDILEEVSYAYPVYGITDQAVYSSSAEKTREKTPVQYISILYGDLFDARIPNNELNNLTLLSTAIGDKGLVNELILSHYLTNPDLVVPTQEEMQANPEVFAQQTYVRFYKRNPTPYEALFLVNLIENDPSLTVEVVYTAFVLSNEYYFY